MEPVLRLTVLDGGGVLAPGDVIECDGEGETLGRSPTCTKCLPDATVSRRHARISRSAGQWVVTDLGSSAGTYLNRARIDAHEPTVMREGDELGIGACRLLVGDRPNDDTRTVALLREANTLSATHAPSRRLSAISALIDRMIAARDEEELARAALETTLIGGGFKRGAILRPIEGDRAVIVSALVRTQGELREVDPEDVRVPSSLVATALGGSAAVLRVGEESDAQTAVSLSIHSAVCAPAMVEGRIVALLYADARASEAPVTDAASFCEDVAQLFGFATVYASRAELERRQAELRTDLERARVVRDMLSPPALVEAGRWRIAHRMTAGMLVSGDLFEAHTHDDGSAVVLFGDATGHGVSAALLSSLVHAYLHAEVAREGDIQRAIERTNRFIAQRATGGGFVSLWVGKLGGSGDVQTIDAGHGHWLVRRADGRTERASQADGIPLGIDPSAAFQTRSITLEPGDRVIIYTDGISERRTDIGEMFGVERVLEALGGSRSCEDDVARVVEAADRAAGGSMPEDDATVASIEFR
ncbi:MAG: SpoIIE family protein phosphatase [Planctomycetota bacterium]